MASNCQGLEKYSRQDLQHLLDTPELLESVYQTTHPQAQHNLQALTDTWATNRVSAERILARQEELRQTRNAAGEKLAEAKELEKQWQAKQVEMEQALKPFSPPALYSKLETLATESELFSETLATSFLEGEDGDVTDFIREYRAHRKQYHIRRERKEKWQQGQVTGWR